MVVDAPPPPEPPDNGPGLPLKYAPPLPPPTVEIDSPVPISDDVFPFVGVVELPVPPAPTITAYAPDPEGITNAAPPLLVVSPPAPPPPP